MTCTKEAVQKGANLLDDNVEGWADKVCIQDLDMACIQHLGPGTRGCVLAQLFGTYKTGLDFLGMNESGYMACVHGFDGDNYVTLSAWNKLWIQEILNRREHDSL